MNDEFTREELRKVLTSKKFTAAEKKLLECLYARICHPGSFQQALFHAVMLADPDNRSRLALGFQAEVNAVDSWQRGNLYALMKAVAGAEAESPVIPPEGKQS